MFFVTDGTKQPVDDPGIRISSIECFKDLSIAVHKHIGEIQFKAFIQLLDAAFTNRMDILLDDGHGFIVKVQKTFNGGSGFCIDSGPI